MTLANKTAVITGGAKGIGQSIALKFANEGANLVLLDIDQARLDSTTEECKKLGVKVIAFKIDIRDENALYKVAENVFSTFEKIDIIVNNAGVWELRLDELNDAKKSRSFLNTSNLAWQRMIDINIMGTVNTIKAFVSKMIEQKNGKIINFGSVAGVNGIPTMSEYSATKGAIISLTKALAHEFSSYNINVNCISPGSVSTEGRPAPSSYLGIATPEDMANATAFLASDDAKFITGHNLIVDGGRTLSLKCD